jgi:hypothetical protein
MTQIRIEVNFKNSLGQFKAKIEPSEGKAHHRGDHQVVAWLSKEIGGECVHLQHAVKIDYNYTGNLILH